MNPLSERELRMNQQAAMAAASVLSEPVEAAARCEQVTRDMRREASGFRGLTRGLMRANDALGRATPGTMGQMSTQMETAGLPSSFILAVTRSHVHAIEESRIMQAAARNAAAAGSPGFPHQMMVAKDAPSQRLIDALGATGGAGPNIIIGGKHLHDIIAEQAAPAAAARSQPPVAQRLQELETLRATGVISDAEYTSKREQIISEP